MMKIVYLIAGTYRAAGMERVLAMKANWFASRGDEVLIVTTEQKGRAPAFPLDSAVRTIDLNIGYEDNNGGSFLSKLLLHPFKLLLHRHRLSTLLKTEKADVVVSMFCNDASFVPSIRDGSRKVLEIHFSRFKRLQYARRGLWRMADRLRSLNDARVASRYDRFVVLTREDMGYWGDMDNVRVIPNARTFSMPAPSDPASRQVLAVGRYSYQKGFDRLVEAWRRIDTSGWTLRIAGEGEDLGELPSNVITGPSSDIVAEYSASSIFALSSRYEGLPMVLLEAQAAGLPIVSFACKCGPADVVTDGVDGYLVKDGDIDAFASGLKALMDDVELRRSMGEASFASSDRFREENIMKQWKELFEGLL